MASLIYYFNDKRHGATSGVLTGGQSATRNSILLGGSRIFPGPNGVVLTDAGDPVLTVHLKQKKLYVSAKIRNERGELLAELKDNEWTLQPRPAIFDRNYTDDVLEIRDASGNVALQVVDFGDDVYVAGAWHCSNGLFGVAAQYYQQKTIFEILRPGWSPLHPIPPICDYPSEQHLGSCPRTDMIDMHLHSVPLTGTTRLEICPPLSGTTAPPSSPQTSRNEK